MILRNELVFVIVALFIRKLQGEYPSVPCPHIFQYFRSGEKIMGYITVDKVDYGDNTLEVKLSQLEEIETENKASLEFDFDYKNSQFYIAENIPFVYVVTFPNKNVIPKVRAIRFNGVDICPVRKVPAEETIINLQHTFTIPSPSNLKNKNSQQNDSPSHLYRYVIEWPTDYNSPRTTESLNFGTRRITISRPSTTKSPPTTIKQVERFDFIKSSNDWRHINSVCGQENLNQMVTKLVVNGESIPRARFPWIVALFLSKRGTLSYRCGGSLITTRTVISAAHCFYSGYNVIDDEDILVSMGRHYLNEWSDSDTIFNSDVEKIIQHPDYNSKIDNNDADLAIVQLKKRVTFSDYIRPVCMWEGAIDLNEIEGVPGIVVGWGRDEKNNEVTTTPKLARVKVVSEISCIRSNSDFIHYTSNRTLCAGNRDGSGPCTGDSGNGLMIQDRNKWRLRGIVSLAKASEKQPCNLQEYVVYTDIAQFLGWIYDNSLF